MTEIKNDKNYNPDFPKPTENEIKKTRQTIEDKYGVILPNEDATRFVILTKELNWWLNLKNNSVSMARIMSELMVECEDIFQKKHDKAITEPEAVQCAEELLASVTKKEKKRIGDEMTTLLKSNK